MLAKRMIRLHHFWFFGQHCNEWHNESRSGLRSNLESPYKWNLRRNLSVVVVRIGKLIDTQFSGSKLAPPTFKIGRSPGTRLRHCEWTDFHAQLHKMLKVPMSLHNTRPTERPVHFWVVWWYCKPTYTCNAEWSTFSNINIFIGL